MSTENENAKTNAKGGSAAAATKEIRKGPKTLGTIILAVLAIVALVGGTIWAVNAIGYVSTDDAAIDAIQIKLSSRILGRISAIAVTEGAKVESGDTLVALDATDLKAQAAQAEASLAYARQNLVLAKINLDKTRGDSERVQVLYKSAAATRESYDHSINALEAAQAQFDLAGAQVATAVAQLGVIKAQLLNTTLSAPIAGTVDKISLSVGDVVQPGQTILSVNDLDDVWVIANLEETKIGRIGIGSPVKITVDAYGKHDFAGTVELVRAGIVPSSFQIGEFTKTTQRIPVKIRITSIPEGVTLIPGMSVEVKIRTNPTMPF